LTAGEPRWIREVLRHDPLAGHIFVFVNRRKTQMKLLVYTRGGFTIMSRASDVVVNRFGHFTLR